ncbi:MAG: hypothetical protein NUW37_10980 [Planctomycetes bacterium]|nr:hypothetical protein [Planctomycetota bacterium]
MKAAFHFIVFVVAFASFAGAAYFYLEVQPDIDRRLSSATDGNVATVHNEAVTVSANQNAIDSLRARIAELEDEITVLRNTQYKVSTIENRLEEVEGRTETLSEATPSGPAEASAAGSAPSQNANGEAVNIPAELIREQLDAELERRDAEERAQRQERMREMATQMQDRRVEQIKAIEEKLVSEAFIDPATASQVSSVIQNYDATVTELNKRMFGDDTIAFPAGTIFGGGRGGPGGMFSMGGRGGTGGTSEQELGMSQEEYRSSLDNARNSAQESIESLLVTEEQVDLYREIERSTAQDAMGMMFGGGGGRGGNNNRGGNGGGSATNTGGAAPAQGGGRGGN